jgi:hypothetical protein
MFHSWKEGVMARVSRSFFVFLCIRFFSLPLYGCADRDPAEGGIGEEGACEVEGAFRCSDDLGAIERCLPGEGGTLVWTSLRQCGGDTACDFSEGLPRCLCLDECSDGDAQCDGSAVQICVAASGGCRAWQTVHDCADEGLICTDGGGGVECAAACIDICPVPGDERCSGSTIQACRMSDEGCLAWIDVADCSDAGLRCEVDGADAACVCDDLCEPEDTACSGTTLQTCTLGESGCYVFSDLSDCLAEGSYCDPEAGPPACRNGSGESCDDFLYIASLPFERTGESFADDFRNSHDFAPLRDDFTCPRSSGNADAVFALDLMDGETVFVEQTGETPTYLIVQDSCGGDVCYTDHDTPSPSVAFKAPDSGRYFVIVEALSTELAAGSYRIVIDVLREECGDGMDNDADGAVDCADRVCFGALPHCRTESLCGDSFDNDDDGLLDCDDPDCASVTACLKPRGLWELFDDASPVDVEGRTIMYKPELSAANRYTWIVSDGPAAFPEEPGSGEDSTLLGLGAGDAVEYAFSRMGGFPFFSTTRTALFVGSSGCITFDEADAAVPLDAGAFFAVPRMAGLASDLDPAAGGIVVVDEFSDRLVVTFDAVPHRTAAESVSFQIVLHATGFVDVHYLAAGTSNAAMIGLSNGGLRGALPDESDLVL